jgi:hypothetical protein
MSRPRITAPRLAASRCCKPPLRAGDAASAAGEQRPPAEALACPKGVFGSCAPEGSALKCLLFHLSVQKIPGRRLVLDSQRGKIVSRDTELCVPHGVLIL